MSERSQAQKIIEKYINPIDHEDIIKYNAISEVGRNIRLAESKEGKYFWIDVLQQVLNYKIFNQ
jgi:hypothetical protein